ncbi:hypothetical protein N665_1095s0009 [Sinapis alba]|nr:hypothetical protein N665_1095s0009 [Sinapis alba]
MSSTSILSSQKPPSIEPTPNLPLPDDLVFECLARVLRLHYPILSLVVGFANDQGEFEVCREFRSLTASPELYKTRSLLNRTEKCLYLCLQFPTEPNLRWFTLCRKPDKTLNIHICEKNETSSGNVLAPVQILNSCPVEWSSLVAIAGSYENPDSLNFVEVFNTNTQTWKAVSNEKRVFRSTDFEGKVYKNLDLTSGKRDSLVLKLKDSTIDWVGFSTLCLIEKIFYAYGLNGEFIWSNAHYSNVKVYVRASGGYKEKMIWCAAISLEIRSS